MEVQYRRSIDCAFKQDFLCVANLFCRMYASINNYPARETRRERALPGSVSVQNLSESSTTVEDQLRDVINTSILANSSEQVGDKANGLDNTTQTTSKQNPSKSLAYKENQAPKQQEIVKSAVEDNGARKKDLIKALQNKTSSGRTAATTGGRLEDADGESIESQRWVPSHSQVPRRLMFMIAKVAAILRAEMTTAPVPYQTQIRC
jgi:hypothetical protein